MNNARRKTISKSLDTLKSVLPILKKALDAETAALTQIPDDDDNEDRRDAVKDVVENLENAISSLEDAINTLDSSDF